MSAIRDLTQTNNIQQSLQLIKLDGNCHDEINFTIENEGLSIQSGESLYL